MSNNSVSVLMCVYSGDKPKFVTEAVDSIFSQTRMPDQLVIVIDGPVPPEITHYIDKLDREHGFIKVHKLEKNEGFPQALNSGLKFITGDWVFRFDADDIMLDNRIKVQLTELEKNSVDVLGGQILEFDEAQNIFQRTVPTDHNAIKKRLPWRNPMNHVTVAFDAKLIKSMLYRNVVGFEDYDLWYRLLANPSIRIQNMDAVLVKVRVGSEMYGRRTGIGYALGELKFRKATTRYAHNFLFHWTAGVLRIFTSMLPKVSKAQIYQKFLRHRTN